MPEFSQILITYNSPQNFPQNNMSERINIKFIVAYLGLNGRLHRTDWLP